MLDTDYDYCLSQDDLQEKPSRILLVHNFYQVGGGEHVVFANEKRLLEKNGHTVIAYTRDNYDIKRLSIRLAAPFTTTFSLRTFFEIRSLIDKHNIQIVHCHNTFPLVSPSIYYAARSKKIPVIQTIHNYRLLCINGLFYRDNHICEECSKQGLLCGIRKKCYRHSYFQSYIIAFMLWFHRRIHTYQRLNYIFLTEFCKKKFTDSPYFRNICSFVKPNFVFENRYSDGAHILPAKGRVCIYIGRLDDNKGIRFLLRVWGKCNPATLHVYGDGVLKSEVTKAAASNENIKYFGFCKQEMITEDLCSAEMLVFPSECYEGFPMTILESLSLGVPVLACNIGNQGSMIKDGVNGYKYSVGNEYEFIDGMNAIRSMELVLRKRAYEFYQLNYKEESNYSQLMKIYQSVLNNA